MARRVAIKNIEPLELSFSDGTVKRAWFTPASMIKLTTEYDDINKLLEESALNPYDTLSKILHCALSIEHPNTTLDEAKMIIIQGGDQILTEVYAALTDSFNLEDDDVKKKLIQVQKSQMK